VRVDQDRALVSIATFDSSIQFYNVKSSDGSPQVIVMSDISEAFSPSPNLLLPLAENRGSPICIFLSEYIGSDSILEILDLIPKLHESQTKGESCAGSAIEVLH